MIWFILFLLAFSFPAFAQATERGFDHSLYERVLRQYVKDGLVDYRGLKQNPADLHRYLQALTELDPQEYEQWSREEKVAFWINAYNAITIEGILRNYPISYGNLIARIRFPRNSIRQISDFWDTVFLPVMGRPITLNEIEHQILRKQFREPRVHFVLVCASMGCPRLANYAFVGDSLEVQLERETRRFVNDPQKVRLDLEGNTLYLSSIFKWYAEDFLPFANREPQLTAYGEKERGVVAFILPYLPAEQAQFIRQKQPRIRYLPYDWSLNDLHPAEDS